MVLYKKVMVGIFSRESEEAYRWLSNLLTSTRFRSVVQDVRLVNVSNTVCGHSYQLSQEIGKCSFAILYHTKKRGRLNVTDVTDSLYDRELQHLSETLGRERVIVLVDDVDTDDSEVYNRILTEQPLIPQLSGLLVVISQDEKNPSEHNGGGLTSDSQSYQQVTTIRSTEKIEKIRSKIRKARELNVPFVLLIGFLVAMLIIIIIVALIES